MSAPKIDNTAGGLKGQMEREIQQYLTETVNIGDNIDFSQYKLVRRISLFESHTYPTGKFDSQGNYKFWYDIITSAIDNEVKNVDFNTKDISVWSERKSDEFPCLICNLKLKEYLRTTGQADEINEAVEEGAGWGNVVWKKVKGGYERVDLKNFYVINQTAECLDETPVIERHQLSQTDLRAKSGTWSNVKEVIEGCGSNTYKSAVENQSKDTTVPYYDVYERNGEVCLRDLKQTLGQEPADGDEDRYVFAKLVGAGTKDASTSTVSIEFIMFAGELKGKTNEDLYKEYHRGRYKGRWFREGLYELLFDCQVRANQIGNQIAQGLEFASKLILSSRDKLVVQNILSDLKNGDVLRAEDLKQVDMRMHGFDQLAADWNLVKGLAQDIANASPISRGAGIPQGAPFRVVALLNQNANKLYNYIREKIGIPFSEMFEEWIVPDLVDTLSDNDILRLSGDSDMLQRACEIVVEDWYLNNLVAIGPHGQDVADLLRMQKLQELTQRPHLLVNGIRKLFKDFTPHVEVLTTGEGSTKDEDIQMYETFAGIEADPVRRSALIEKAMKRAGIDVGDLPKTPPQQMQGLATPQSRPTASPDMQPSMAAAPGAKS